MSELRRFKRDCDAVRKNYKKAIASLAQAVKRASLAERESIRECQTSGLNAVNAKLEYLSALNTHQLAAMKVDQCVEVLKSIRERIRHAFSVEGIQTPHVFRVANYNDVRAVEDALLLLSSEASRELLKRAAMASRRNGRGRFGGMQLTRNC
jgi:hypothetical protein